MKVTQQLIDQGKSTKGGWSKKQLALLGVAWPPAKGWQAGVIGREISDSDADQFVKLSGNKRSGGAA